MFSRLQKLPFFIPSKLNIKHVRQFTQAASKVVGQLEIEAIDDGVVDQSKVNEDSKKVEIAKKKSEPKAEDTRSRRQEDGVNNIMTVISVIFSVSVLVFIGVGKF